MRPIDATPRKRRDTIPPRERESNLRGETRLPLLLASVGAALLLVVLLLRPEGEPFPPAPEDAGSAAASTKPEQPPPPASAAEIRERKETLLAPPPPGKGRIRVFLLDPPEDPRRTDRLVSIGPTPLLLSPGAAVERTAILRAGEDRCVFEDLPDAAYLVRAAGEGLSPVESPIAIGPRSRDVAVRLVLRRAVFVDGSVLDEEGTPLEGVAVRLEREKGSSRALETRSDAAGRYRIDGVVAGVYRLLAGPHEAPLLAPVRIAIDDSPLRHDVRLPVLGSLEVTVVDAEGRPLPARLDGWGPPGGTFHAETSPEGTHVARNLPAGDYWLAVRAERFETRFEETKVTAREAARLRVALRPTR